MNENPQFSEALEDADATATSPALKQGWLRALLFFIVFFILSQIAAGIALVLVALAEGLDLSQVLGEEANVIGILGPWRMSLIMLAGFAGTMLAVWLFRRFVDRKSIMSLGFQWDGYSTDFVAGGLWGIGLISVGCLIQYIAGLTSMSWLGIDVATQLGYLILFSIVALNEEIMARGYLLSNLTESFGQWPALLVSSLIFSVMHAMNANVTLFSLLNIMLAGVLLGIYYVHKQNLWFPIAMHWTWNYVQGPVLGYEVSGNATDGIFLQVPSGSDLLTGGEFGFEGSLIATVLMIAATVVIHIRYSKTSQEAVRV